MTKRERTRATVGSRLADRMYADGTVTCGLVERLAIARRIDAAVKRAVREGYEAGYEDGPGHRVMRWNDLADKYGMVAKGRVK